MTDLPIRGRWYQGAGDGARLWSLELRHPEPVGGVFVVHGYSEHSGRYRHVLAALGARGFSAVAPDVRGHGRSARLPGWIGPWRRILQDHARLADHLERLAPGRPLYLLGHSMGALLCLLQLHHDRRWAGAVLNGTALAVPDQVSPAVLAAARVLGGVAPWLPLQPFYDPTRGSRDPAVVAASLADPFAYKGWVRAGTAAQALDAMQVADRVAPEIRVPILLTHGGADRTVPVSASARLHARLGAEDKELHVFDGLLHEVHNEPERDRVLARWGIWLSRHAGALR